MPLAASAAGLEGLPGGVACPLPAPTLLSAASLSFSGADSHPAAQSHGGQDPAQALPESTVCPEEALHRRRCSFSIWQNFLELRGPWGVGWFRVRCIWGAVGTHRTPALPQTRRAEAGKRVTPRSAP